MKQIHFFFFLTLIFLSCQDSTDKKVTSDLAQKKSVHGETMGTTYNITYFENSPKDRKPAIDSLLADINQSVSTYIVNSTISKFNQSEKSSMIDAHFLNVFKEAEKVAEISGGCFDYTVMPLVNAWGFGFKEKEKMSTEKIDSLLTLVGYKNVRLDCKDSDSCVLQKNAPGIMVDFSAIAKGYAVDAVGEFLSDRGVKDYLVEIGGEVRTSGTKKGAPWKIGIDNPVEEAVENRTKTIVGMTDMSMATSGNYRNYYEEDGVKYAHTIDPKTGYPAKNELLSASVISRTCMTADAFATAFMVMGLDKALQLADSLDYLDAYFIYRGENNEMKTVFSRNFNSNVRILEEYK